MTIQEFQYVSNMDTGSTSYEMNLLTYFNINKSQPISKIRNEIGKRLNVKEKKLKKWTLFNNGIWRLQNNFLEHSFEQWKRLETILAEDNNINNLHRILGIYFRPINQEFNYNTQDKIENDLLKLDMGLAHNIMNLIFSNRDRVYELYRDLLFSGDEVREEKVYQKQIDNINRFFMWDFVQLEMINNDITKMKVVDKYPLQFVLDYLVVRKQDHAVEEMKNSKNALPL